MSSFKQIGFIASAAILGGACISWIAPSITKSAPIEEQERGLARFVAEATRSTLIMEPGYCWHRVPGILGDVETPWRRKTDEQIRRYQKHPDYQAVMRVSFKYLDIKFTEQGMTMFKRVPDEQHKTPKRMLVPYCPSVQTAKP